MQAADGAVNTDLNLISSAVSQLVQDNTHLLHANVPELRKDQQLDAAALCTDILNHLKEKQA